MKVLFLDSHPHIHGPLPKIFAALVPALRRAGCTVVTRPWGHEGERESIAAKVVRGVRDLLIVVTTLRRERCDLLFVNTAHDWKSLARDLPLLACVRFVGHRSTVIWLHGSQSDRLAGRPSIFGWLSGLLVRLSTAIFVLSKEEETQWRTFRRDAIFRVARLTLPMEPAGTIDGAAAIPQLLFVARLIPEKGLMEVLEAMPGILAETDCHLLVAGDGPLAASAKQLVATLGITGRVSFKGYIQGSELAAAYATASILVFPTYHCEGFPVVVLEAMRAGLPIVTTRIRGAADWLQDPANVMFVPPRRPDAVAQAVVTLLADPSRMRRMSVANGELAAQFEPDVVAREWLTNLRDLVDA